MQPKGIVIHLTASSFGDVPTVDRWHRERGFSMIGYHRLILNGKLRSNGSYNASQDGIIQRGRPDNQMGAHCLAESMNVCTFGISCVGMPGVVLPGVAQAGAELTAQPYLTQRQAAALIDALARLCMRHGFDPQGTFVHPTTGRQKRVISQHSDHDPGKPLCASLRMNAVRAAVAARIASLNSGPQAMAMASANDDFEPVEFFEGQEEVVDEPQADVPPPGEEGDNGTASLDERLSNMEAALAEIMATVQTIAISSQASGALSAMDDGGGVEWVCPEDEVEDGQANQDVMGELATSAGLEAATASGFVTFGGKLVHPRLGSPLNLVMSDLSTTEGEKLKRSVSRGKFGSGGTSGNTHSKGFAIDFITTTWTDDFIRKVVRSLQRHGCQAVLRLNGEVVSGITMPVEHIHAALNGESNATALANVTAPGRHRHIERMLARRP